MHNPHRRLRPRVVVIGGGYAGLTACLELARSARFDVVLVDRHPAFLDAVQLHRTVHTPLDELRIPYSELLKPWNVHFYQADLDLSEDALLNWETAGALPLTGEHLAFDYLLLASGARSRRLTRRDTPPQVYTLDDLKQQDLSQLLAEFLATHRPVERVLSVIGGGATGMQFLFELDDHLRRNREPCLINFINVEERLLSAFPARFGEYALRKLRSRRGTIDYYPGSRFLAQQDGRVSIQHYGDKRSLESVFSLEFAGVEPAPHLPTNPCGQAVVAGKLLERVYAAGDCADFAGGGMNSLSAQAAVRKARAVAENILRAASDRAQRHYDYRELGYFVSLGPGDGVGWMLSRNRTLTGLAAFAAKNAIEAQFRLFLQGVDTYIDR